ncbi:MAG: segregation/condensation protein A [Armatimonadetes bacterium CG07_land_8_20_14_0_80_59_28]|nr:MAG: segregation/condensation protein A [Armatimonadetes bacterium CG07_land_8_20_14_0_80_59_28]
MEATLVAGVEERLSTAFSEPSNGSTKTPAIVRQAPDSRRIKMYQDRFTGHPISLRLFEGPLDLLLFLIRENQVHIYDIPIAEITDQYLSYVRLRESLDIELAGDFMVMASTLLVIKSKMLLPKAEEKPGDSEVEEDTREGLIRKLLEYKRFKEAADTLKSLGEIRSMMFDRPLNGRNGHSNGNGNGHQHPSVMFVRSVSALELCVAFQEVLERVGERPAAEIPRQLLTIPMRIKHIMRTLKAKPEGATFWEICEDCVTRDTVIVTFLALLELIRLLRVRVFQPQNFGEIRVAARNDVPALT